MDYSTSTQKAHFAFLFFFQGKEDKKNSSSFSYLELRRLGCPLRLDILKRSPDGSRRNGGATKRAIRLESAPYSFFPFDTRRRRRSSFVVDERERESKKIMTTKFFFLFVVSVACFFLIFLLLRGIAFFLSSSSNSSRFLFFVHSLFHRSRARALCALFRRP